MTLTQLKYIIAVDTHRHFATAAEKCFVTQPTLSMQIQKLEEELGVLIFDRSKHPVVPTQIGVKIVEQARSTLQEANLLRDIASSADSELSGYFRVGIIPTIAPYLIPLFIRSFTERYPRVELVFEEAMTKDLLHRLNNDDLDASILATPAGQNGINEQDLFFEPFVGYLSSSHPLSSKDTLEVDDLDVNNLWLLTDGHCFRDQTVKLCKQGRHSSRNNAIEFESGNLETLKKLVEQNFGMTLLPYLAISDRERMHDEAMIREFNQPVPIRKVRLAYGRKHLKKKIIEAFTEEIRLSVPPELLSVESSMIIE